MSELRARGPAAFVFPGVGVAPSGHEREFYERHEAAMAPWLAHAGARAGEDFAAALAQGRLPPPGTAAAELFTYAYDCGVAAAWRHAGVEPALIAGHSLGLYAALAAAEAVRFEDGLAMVAEARRLAEESCGGGEFGMGAVIGLREAEILALLSHGGFNGLARVNANNATASVVSGVREDLERFLAAALDEGALKAVRLDLGLPYHNPLYLGGAVGRFDAFLGGLAWRAPCCPVVSSLDQRPLIDPASLREFTARNFAAPIHWQRVVEALARLGAAVALECGPGISLTQHSYFIPGAPPHVNIKTAKWKLGI